MIVVAFIRGNIAICFWADGTGTLINVTNLVLCQHYNYLSVFFHRLCYFKKTVHLNSMQATWLEGRLLVTWILWSTNGGNPEMGNKGKIKIPPTYFEHQKRLSGNIF